MEQHRRGRQGRQTRQERGDHNQLGQKGRRLERRRARGIVVEIILVVINEVIRAPFDNKSTCLDERLAFVHGESFNAGDAAGVGDWNDGPLMARDVGAGCKRQKIIVVAVGISSGYVHDGTKRPSFGGVGGVGGLKNLNILPELDAHAIIVTGRRASNDRKRTGVARNAVAPWELIQAAHGVGNEVNNEQLGDSLEREPVNGGAKALLNSFDRTLHVPDVAFRWDDVHMCRPDLLLDTFEFLVGVNIDNVEAAGAVKVDEQLDFAKNRIMRPIGDGYNRSETNGA